MLWLIRKCSLLNVTERVGKLNLKCHGASERPRFHLRVLLRGFSVEINGRLQRLYEVQMPLQLLPQDSGPLLLARLILGLADDAQLLTSRVIRADDELERIPIL